MSFNSYEFIFLFFPLVLLGSYVCKKVGEKIYGGRLKDTILGAFLIVASLIFYGWIIPSNVPVLLMSMAINYFLGWQMERIGKSATGQRTTQDNSRKALLIIGLAINLGFLAVTKYASVEFVPLGISFFTFTQIAYLMECYRGNIKGVRILEYGFYVTFFPKLVQGPIALPGEMLAQYRNLGKRLNWEKIFRGFFLFVLGLFKKVLIADTFGRAVDYGYTNLAQLNSGDGLLLMLSFTLQLYFDFSGYCDMAMGIACLFGIELPLNFNSPYKAVNIIDFWKRWHITLTTFFTKYLYIPLGGNRKGKSRTAINCLIVFFLSGLWHGAGWQFIIWGMMHGVLYVLTKAFLEKQKEKATDKSIEKATDKTTDKATSVLSNNGLASLRRGISVFLTFLYVNIAWVFFRAPSVQEALSVFKIIGSLNFGRINWDLADCFNLDEFWYIIKILRLDSWQYAHYILLVVIVAAVLILIFFGKNAVAYVKIAKPSLWNVLLMTVLLVWSVISLSGVSSFIYVNF